MTRVGKCPHCKKPIVIKIAISQYESMWWLNHKAQIDAEKKRRAEKTIAQLNRDGLLPKEYKAK